MKKNIKLPSIIVATLILTSNIYAEKEIPKRSLKSNYQESYNIVPKSVNSLTDALQNGMFYGRVRSNTFVYKWDKETSSQNSHSATGLGGSVIYKSAPFSNFDFTTGLYYSRAFFNNESDPINILKPAKDIVSRYDYISNGDKSMAVLGQAYIRYKGLPKTYIRIGRQKVETFYTKSNDTKMVPNTFDGVVINSRYIPKTSVKIAYLEKQKLRDHTNSHSVLMFDDSNTSGNSKWNSNDDSAMHKGLTYTALKAAGKDTNAPLITGDIRNKSIKNLSLGASFYEVPELLSEIMTEANYRIDMNGFSITPGIRYIKQFDLGAGKIGGASYNGKLAGVSGASAGYKDANSLDAQMIATRLVGVYENFRLNLGYSNVLDEADLVTPWRGFPTAGYTRSMARYNWMANTKSYRAEIMINRNKKGIYKDVYMQLSFLHTDADEAKGYFDENYYYAGFIQNIPSYVDLQWRLRVGYTDTKKADADNLDGRFELNYLF